MSAINYYLSKGYTPINKQVVISGPDTIAVWGPVSGNRFILTDLSISANQAGTIVFNLHDEKTANYFARFSVGGSVNISPSIGCVEGTMVGGKIWAITTGNTTEGWRINLTGFEDGAF